MLINCTEYNAGTRVRELAVEEIPDAMTRRDGFIWIGLKDPDPEEILRMQTIFDLPELAVEDTLHGQQRPKVEEYEGMLFVSMKVAEMAGDEIHFGELYVFMNDRFLLSIRSHVKQGFREVRARAERETELLKLGPAFVLYALTDAVVDRFFPIVEGLETRLEDIETRIFQAPPSRRTMEALHQIKEHVVDLRHAVPAVRDDAAFRIAGGGNSAAIRQSLQDYYRDVHDHIQRISQSLEGLRDNVSMAAQVNLSLISLEQSEVSKKLAAWAAIFGMMTTLAGIWGMNFEFMPELKLTWGYPVALLLMAIIGILLYRRFRKVGWL